MKEKKPIDKTKKSNRRCVNCEHYPHKGTYYTNRDVIEHPCEVSGKRVDYWCCCKEFEWSRDKVYKEEQT